MKVVIEINDDVKAINVTSISVDKDGAIHIETTGYDVEVLEKINN